MPEIPKTSPIIWFLFSFCLKTVNPDTMLKTSGIPFIRGKKTAVGITPERYRLKECSIDVKTPDKQVYKTSKSIGFFVKTNCFSVFCKLSVIAVISLRFILRTVTATIAENTEHVKNATIKKGITSALYSLVWWVFCISPMPVQESMASTEKRSHLKFAFFSLSPFFDLEQKTDELIKNARAIKISGLNFSPNKTAPDIDVNTVEKFITTVVSAKGPTAYASRIDNKFIITTTPNAIPNKTVNRDAENLKPPKTNNISVTTSEIMHISRYF